MSEENKLQSELGIENENPVSLLDIINIMETSGDVLDHKIFNFDYKVASYYPTPGIEEAFGPYVDEDDDIYYKFFSGEDDILDEDGVQKESLPKINSKYERFAKLKKIYGDIKWIF